MDKTTLAADNTIQAGQTHPVVEHQTGPFGRITMALLEPARTRIGKHHHPLE
jgi:hypothetical protein